VEANNYDILKEKLMESTFPLVGRINNIIDLKYNRERRKTLFLIADKFEENEIEEKMKNYKKKFRNLAEKFQKNAAFAILPINTDTVSILKQYLPEDLSVYKNFPILVRISDNMGDLVLDQNTQDLNKISSWVESSFLATGNQMKFAKEDL
jgi:hypothetical protein